MAKFKSDFLNVLDQRGFIHQISDPEGLDALAAKQQITGYIGYDATATSIHIGNLITVTMLYWLQETGHRAISLMGGGTSMVGDPSFRDDQRQLLSIEKINANIESIKKVYSRILNYGGSNPTLMVNNADWLLELKYVEFLRDVGRHFSVNRMLSFDSVKLRLDREQPLSFLEFNYMVMQGYDFVELNRRYGTVLQMGGSDQWGNIISGVDLGHRMLGLQFYAVTTPLLTKSSGEKMGKSASGAVWLNGDLFSPYDFWQYFRNAEDADVEKWLKIFTRLPLDEIARLASLGGVELNEAKKILATEVTAIVHGREAAEQAAETARATFETGALDLSLPTRTIDTGPDAKWKIGRTTTAILAASGLVPSQSEARRKIAERALRINDRLEEDPDRIVRWEEKDPRSGGFKVQLGKKKFALVIPKK
ncbi:MAG: tyrosine--tRNA ligase [Devosia sp.]